MKTASAYKQIGDLTIHTDVYRPATKDVLPVAVWIHGGALINGQRSSSGLDERKWVRPRYWWQWRYRQCLCSKILCRWSQGSFHL